MTSNDDVVGESWGVPMYELKDESELIDEAIESLGVWKFLEFALDENECFRSVSMTAKKNIL